MFEERHFRSRFGSRASCHQTARTATDNNDACFHVMYFRIYATLPMFKDQLLDISREWLNDGIEMIKQKTRVLNIVLMVFIIGQMAMIALSVMDIQTQLTTQTMGGVR